MRGKPLSPVFYGGKDNRAAELPSPTLNGIQKNIPPLGWGWHNASSLIIILFTTSSSSKEAVRHLTSSQLIIYNPESDKNSQECVGKEKGRGSSCCPPCPQVSVCIPHTSTNTNSHLYLVRRPLPAMDTPQRPRCHYRY